MLIHHFGAETKGFQGLWLTKMTEGKPKSPKKSHFLKETPFGGGSGFLNFF